MSVGYKGKLSELFCAVLHIAIVPNRIAYSYAVTFTTELAFYGFLMCLPVWFVFARFASFRNYLFRCFSYFVFQEEKPNSIKSKHLDFLDILLMARDENGCGLTDVDIRNEVDNFLFAGYNLCHITAVVLG